MFEGERFNTFMGSGSTGHRMYDLTGPALDHRDLDFLGGAMFFDGSGERTPIGAVEGIPASDEPTDGAEQPEWGSAFKERMREWDSWLQIGISGESIAYEPHRLDLDPAYTDAFGRPLLRLTFDWTPNEYAMYRFMAARGAEIMAEMGPDREQLEPELEPYNIADYGSTHNQGGAIMGSSPDDSVTNRYGQVWDTPNVFVAGAALFPQNPPANPTGTVCALAYHTADAYVANYRDGELLP